MENIINGEEFPDIVNAFKEYENNNYLSNGIQRIISGLITVNVFYNQNILEGGICTPSKFKELNLLIKETIATNVEGLLDIDRVTNIVTIIMSNGVLDSKIIKNIIGVLERVMFKEDLNNEPLKEQIVEYGMYRQNLYNKMLTDVFYVLDTNEIDSDKVTNEVLELAGLVDNSEDYFINSHKVDKTDFLLEIVHKEYLNQPFKVFRISIDFTDKTYILTELEISDSLKKLIANIKSLES